MRIAGWQKEFWSVVGTAGSRNFEWGTHDCVTFAAECVQAITGDRQLRNRIRKEFGAWSDLRSALKAHNGQLGFAIDSFLGARVNWPALCMGDLGLAIDEDAQEIVVVHDGLQFICPDKVGLRSVPFRFIKSGWKI